MALSESLDQLTDQRKDLVKLAVQRCEDVLRLDPGFIERSNAVFSDKAVDPSRIIASHIETLKGEFYPDELREQLIERGKEIWEMGHLDGMWEMAREAREEVSAMLDEDDRVETARLDATSALRSGLKVDLRATFDTYSGYEPSVEELKRDLAELSGEIEKVSPGGLENEDSPSWLSPRGIILGVGALKARYLK